MKVFLRISCMPLSRWIVNNSLKSEMFVNRQSFISNVYTSHHRFMLWAISLYFHLNTSLLDRKSLQCMAMRRQRLRKRLSRCRWCHWFNSLSVDSDQRDRFLPFTFFLKAYQWTKCGQHDNIMDICSRGFRMIQILPNMFLMT